MHTVQSRNLWNLFLPCGLIIVALGCGQQETPLSQTTPSESEGVTIISGQQAVDEDVFAEFEAPSTADFDASEAAPAASSVSVDIEAKPPKYLSEYGLFSDLPDQIPNPGVIPYELNTSHFADGARVRRFIWLPPGESLTYHPTDRFSFPVGALLIQTLSYPGADGPERLVETRIMLQQSRGWAITSYRWDEAGTNARKAIAGGVVVLDQGDGTQWNYIIPNMNDCKRCHENEAILYPLGITARNVNLDVETPDGLRNQIADWIARGILKDAPEDPLAYPRLAKWDAPESGTVNERARAWLDVNCAHCHNPKGAGNVSGLDLSLGQEDPLRIGVYKPPVAAGRGSEGLRFSIDPGSPNTSFLVRRLLSVDPSVMMPPVGRMTANEAAADLVGAWIAEMSFDEAEAEDLKAKQLEELKRLQESGAWEAAIKAQEEAAAAR